MILRRLKATLVTGLLWALISVPITIVPIIFNHYRFPGGLRIRLWDLMWASAVTAAVQGLCSGVAFAVILMVAERGRTVSELSLRRIVIWGLIGVMTVPMIVMAVLAYGAELYGMSIEPGGLVLLGLQGGGSALLTLLLAKRGDGATNPVAA
jgi:hypothetical protein